MMQEKAQILNNLGINGQTSFYKMTIFIFL